MRAPFPRVLAVALILICLTHCGTESRPDPKQTVKDLFAAIRNSDTLFLSNNVDLAGAAPTLGENLPGGPASGPALLGELTGDGSLRKRWLDNQIVIGRSESSGDTAWVEVSFIDRLTRVQYYNKMRLDYRGDRWVINSFRTM